jgi:type VI secretion system secreted protein VgrG
MSESVVSAALSATATGSTTALPGACVRLLVEEAIGRPYTVTLDILAAEAGLDPAALLGQSYDVTFTWTNAMSGQSGTRRWTGVVVSLTCIGRVQDVATPLHYRAVLQPSLALALRTRRSRVFVAPPDPGYCTPVDVLQRLLTDLLPNGFDTQHIATTTYPRYPFITQFEESDLNFLCRLAESYGISLFWTGDTREDPSAGTGSTLLLTDNNNGFQPPANIPSDPQAPNSVPVNPNAGPASSVRAVYRASMRFGLLSAEAQALTWQAATQAGGTVDGSVHSGTWQFPGGDALQRFGLYPVPGSLLEYRNAPIISPDPSWSGSQGGGTDPRAWPDLLAEMRVEQAAMTKALLLGQSNLEGLFAGCTLQFAAAAEALGLIPKFDANGYVVTSISHAVMAPGSHLCFPDRKGKPDSRTLYRNRFRAVPVLASGGTAATGLTIRPPRRAKRRVVPTLRHATVAAVDTNQLFPDLDQDGRYLVVPDYPMTYVSGSGGQPPGLRVPKAAGFGLASLAAGGNTRVAAGAHAPLRPGQAVLLGFAHGDPDQPFIAGLLPDAFQPSPVNSGTASLPYQTVLRTASGLTVRLSDRL